MKYRNLFWGAVLITIGALFFLKNLGIIFFDWRAILRLWPLLLILWGISILPVKGFFKLLLSFAAIFVTILVIYTNPQQFKYHQWSIRDLWSENEQKELRWDNEKEDETNNHPKREPEQSESTETEWDTQTFTEPFDAGIEKAVIRFDAAIGEFNISESTDELLEFSKKGNLGPYKIISKSYDDKQILALDLEKKTFRGTNFNNIASIKLNTQPVWDMEIDVGAADMDLDLTSFKINQIIIDGGASSLKLKLGDNYEKSILSIDAGASSINIYVPESSGCLIDFDTFLSSRDLEGFEKTESGTWKTSNFNEAANKIIINLDAAVSSFSIYRY